MRFGIKRNTFSPIVLALTPLRWGLQQDPCKTDASYTLTIYHPMITCHVTWYILNFLVTTWARNNQFFVLFRCKFRQLVRNDNAEAWWLKWDCIGAHFRRRSFIGHFVPSLPPSPFRDLVRVCTRRKCWKCFFLKVCPCLLHQVVWRERISLCCLEKRWSIAPNEREKSVCGQTDASTWCTLVTRTPFVKPKPWVTN